MTLEVAAERLLEISLDSLANNASIQVIKGAKIKEIRSMFYQFGGTFLKELH